jgi:hypothetical protein
MEDGESDREIGQGLVVFHFYSAYPADQRGQQQGKSDDPQINYQLK